MPEKNPSPTASPPPSLVTTAVEWVAYGLVVLFAYVLYPPAALLVAAAVLLLWVHRREHTGILAATVTAMVTAARDTHALHRERAKQERR